MSFSKILLTLSTLSIFLAGCYGEILSPNPTPKDFLKYENADIFLLNEYVYSNAQDLEWVSKLEYKLGEQVGEITNKADRSFNFKNGTANKLPIGTKIYGTNTPAYIAIVNGREIPYLKMVEG
ncbi:hypothetical protein WAK64_17870 [Bacillus spongiae]|uniref:Uncharacterized protein n=1 Tax=Bacillus spongiae TaxID=2683610 RepID=A0ABU8HHQ7_9BACI